MNILDQDVAFSDPFLKGMSELDYFVLSFNEKCECDFGLGPNAPYIRFERGNEELHLVATDGVVIRPDRFGIYIPGRILKYELPDSINSGLKLMTAVTPVLEIPQEFMVNMSSHGNSRRGSVNFGPTGDYVVRCLHDRKQIIHRVEHIVKQNTPCDVTISYIIGAFDGVPVVAVAINNFR